MRNHNIIYIIYCQWYCYTNSVDFYVEVIYNDCEPMK